VGYFILGESGVTLAILNAMLGWVPILFGGFLLFSSLFRYPNPEAKYARIGVGLFGASMIYAGIHILLKSK
jgi:hypothetical protein